ncbi:hypothetical protein ACHAPT_001362 [Fusarium lateritium]
MASEADHLCQRCSDIDLDKIFAGGFETPHLVVELGDVPKEQLESPCALCRLIAEAIYRPYCNEDLASYHDRCGDCEKLGPEQDGEPLPYLLLAIEVPLEKHRDPMGHSEWFGYMNTILPADTLKTSSLLFKSQVETAASPPLKKLKDGSFIALKVARRGPLKAQVFSYFGSIYPASTDSNGAAPARLLSSTLDWGLLRSFLAECQKNHSACSSTGGRVPVDSLRLIDCKTRKLKKASPKDSFVALSYVWGEPDEAFSDSRPVDGKLPQTSLVIEDAMKVVTQMGYRYLWVDK